MGPVHYGNCTFHYDPSVKIGTNGTPFCHENLGNFTVIGAKMLYTTPSITDCKFSRNKYRTTYYIYCY